MRGTAAGRGRTDGRPGAALPGCSPAAPEPPAGVCHRPGAAKLEGLSRRWGSRPTAARPAGSGNPTVSFRRAVAVAAALVALSGCSWAGRGGAAYDNGVARASTLRQPAGGTAEERTYRNGRYREASFAGVRVLPPRLEAPPNEDAEYQIFLQDLETALASATAQVLASIPRLGPVNPAAQDGPGVVLVCRTESLVHVTPTGQPVGRDPVFRDPRPKIIVVYRLEDGATGEVVFQYTSVGLSHWEYGPWAMEDLRVRALEIAGELRAALEEP